MTSDFQLSSYFGPLVVAVRKMLKDVVQFFMIFVLIMYGYAVMQNILTPVFIGGSVICATNTVVRSFFGQAMLGYKMSTTLLVRKMILLTYL